MKERGKKVDLSRIKQWFTEQWDAVISVSVKKKKIKFKPFKTIVVVLAFLLCLSLVIELLMIPARRPKTIELGMQTGDHYQIQTFHKDILLYNNQTLKVMNQKGEKVWEANLPLSSPLVETGGQYVLAADLGGNHEAVLYRKGEVVQEFPITKDIISAKVNKKGTVAIATAADGYKGSVLVMNKKGRELFRWNSGDGYIMDLDISDNGHYLAVAQLSSEGSQADTKVQFIDLYQKKVIQTVERTDSVIGEIRFAGNKLIAVSDGELCGFSGSGKLLYEVSFAGKRPGKYDISGDKVLAFSAYDHLGNAVLELYNLRGKLIGSYQADSPITTLAVYDDVIVAARQREILQIKKNGKIKRRTACNHDIMEVGIFGSGKMCMAAGSAEADLIRIP